MQGNATKHIIFNVLNTKSVDQPQPNVAFIIQSYHIDLTIYLRNTIVIIHWEFKKRKKNPSFIRP